jgi:Fe2+ or Zn2+ uptake regulation protein
LPTWEDKLRQQGYRLTEPRRALLKTLRSAAGPLTAAALHTRANRSRNRLGLVTVYRTLALLEELGLVRRLHAPDGCHGYVASTPGHRHTLTCERCEAAVEFDGEEVCLDLTTVAAETGYQVRGHWLQLSGLCPSCQGAK